MFRMNIRNIVLAARLLKNPIKEELERTKTSLSQFLSKYRMTITVILSQNY